LSLDTQDIITAEAVSCGVPFLFIQAINRDILHKVQLKLPLWQTLLSSAWASSIYLFTLDAELPSSSVRSRMFAPGLGVSEDPATGSAATALGGFLGKRSPRQDGTLHWQVEQGFEMNRPSILQIEADIVKGEVVAIRVGGGSVLVSEGILRGIPYL
jgi:trans-2,3-dihydro-3-hydroxyanthranilate isomerase